MIRALGGALFVVGGLIMAWNLWKTVNSGEVAAATPALQPAE
jgi:cytochrome c oxidase cbb3-type subunit 1